MSGSQVFAPACSPVGACAARRGGAGAGLRVECRDVSDVDRDVPPAAPLKADSAAASPRPTLPYQSFPRAGGAVIDINSDGVEIRISYYHARPWGLVIGFGLVALAATAKIVYDATRVGQRSGAGVIAGAVLFALLALAAAVRGATPPLHLIANTRGLRMRGGVLNETLEWRRDEIMSVAGEDLEIPQTNNRRISVVVEVRDDEYVTFPVATREEQAAVVQAMRGALKLTPGTKE